MEFRIDLQNTKETVIAQKNLSDDGETLFLTWSITSAVLKNTPVVEFQLRGFETDGEKIWHSEKSCFYVSTSVDVESEITEEQLSEFQVLEQKASLHSENSQRYCLEAQQYRNEVQDLAQQSLADYTEIRDNTYTKQETDILLDEKSNAGEVYKKSEVDGYILDVLGEVNSAKNDFNREIGILRTTTETAIGAAMGNVYTKDQADTLLLQKADNDDVYTKDDIDEKLKNPSYKEEIKLTEVTTATGQNPVITDNDLAGEIATFHIDVRGSIKFKCEVDRSGGAAEVMGTEIGLGTGKYEYFFEGEVENGFDVQCVMASVTFTEFVKKVYVKDSVNEIESKIGNIDSALDELHSYAAALISGGEA